MPKQWNKLIVALDLEDKAKIKRVVDKLYPKGVKFKIGSIVFTKFGPDFVRGLIKKGADIFLDLKLYDIPNTMKQAAAIIAQMGCWAFTVHVKAGKEALRAVKAEVSRSARKCKKRKPLILGVTELTSKKASKQQVMKLVDEALAVGLDGVIASAWEAEAIKKKSKRIKVITPGIRGANDQKSDQKRVATAKKAFLLGADYIVVGRPIISKKNYLLAAEDILKY